MNFNSFIFSNVRPSFFELVLHIIPGFDAISSQFFEFFLSLILKLPKSVSLLDFPGFFHQKLELFEVTESFIIPPSLLDHNSSHSRPSRSLKHFLRMVNNGFDLLNI